MEIPEGLHNAVPWAIMVLRPIFKALEGFYEDFTLKAA